MKKFITFFTAFLMGVSLQAQPIDSAAYARQQSRIAALEQLTNGLRKQTDSQKEQIASLEKTIAELQTQTENNAITVAVLADSIGVRIDNTKASVEANEASVKLGFILGIVIGCVLLLLTIGLFFLLRHRIAKKGNDIELLRSRADDLNRQMVEKMDKELAELQKMSESVNNVQQVIPQSAEPDHSLIKGLGNNLAIMETNLYKMDKNTRGYNMLLGAIGRIKQNLLASGYELIEMLGKEYIDGMVLDNVEFKDDESIEEGKQIITSVRKPQINYKGKAIQLAQIVVSQNI